MLDLDNKTNFHFIRVYQNYTLYVLKKKTILKNIFSNKHLAFAKGRITVTFSKSKTKKKKIEFDLILNKIKFD